MPASALMNVMIGAARKAGRSLARDFGEVEQLQVSLKGPGDFVSAADLFIIDADGANLFPLTTGQGRDAHPHWSADGGTILFNSDFTGSFDVYRINLLQPALDRLSRAPRNSGNPELSPDGSRIVFNTGSRLLQIGQCRPR